MGISVVRACTINIKCKIDVVISYNNQGFSGTSKNHRVLNSSVFIKLYFG